MSNEARDKLIMSDLESGMSSRAVGEKYGLSYERVRQIGMSNGFVRKPKKKPVLPGCPVCGRRVKWRASTYCSHECAGLASRKDWGDLRPCSKCGEWKHKSEYYEKVKGKHLYAHCKQCHSSIIVEYTKSRLTYDEAFKAARVEASRRWMKRNLDRVRRRRAEYYRKRYKGDPDFRRRQLDLRKQQYRIKATISTRNVSPS